MTELLQNCSLWAAVIANLTAQVLKVILVGVTERRWRPDRLLETGGMPSSHTAAVTALTVGIALEKGLASVEFALAVVFGSIVVYDAAGIRRAAGMQAVALRRLMAEFEHLFDDEGFHPSALKTLLGHTYPQVFVGVIIGLLIGFIVCL